MKISVNKILYHWYSKVYPNFKSKSLQISLSQNFNFNLDININPVKSFSNVYYYNLNLFGLLTISLTKTSEEDHAGVMFTLNLFGFDIDYTNTDVRHWDYENDCWEYYENEIQEMNDNYYKTHKK